MDKKIRRASGALALMACAAALTLGSAQAATAFVDFESTPNLPQGPSIFIAVPGIQTIDAGPATFDGGVVLGLATFFPAISFASSPNVYGTADFGNHLSRTLSIDINPGFITTQVSFALFNGETFSQSYTARAFDGNALVASQTLANVAPNFNSGYGIIDLQAANITRVTIDADGAPAAFDFLIDDVAFNQSLTSVITTPLPPVVQPPAPPVYVDVEKLDVVELDSDGRRNRRQKRKGRDYVQVDFGEDLNNIQSEVLLFAPIPEPSTTGLMLLGLAGMGVLLRRRRAG
jgi:PEP-CTERM motif